MRLEISDAKYGKLHIDKRGADDSLVALAESKFSDPKHYKVAAKELDVDHRDLLRWVDQYRVAAVSTVPLADEQAEAFSVSVRGRLEGAEAADRVSAEAPIEALRLAIGTKWGKAEPLATWEGMDELAAVDVDFHEAEYDLRPGLEELYLLGRRARPAPGLLWSTHGRGLRLVYGRGPDGFTAGELAAVAAVSVKSLSPLATIELKTGTRLPGYVDGHGHECGPVVEQAQTADLDVIRSWLGAREVDQEQVDRWLEEHGVVLGERYDHERCPVRPMAQSAGKPVVVKEDGVFCHSCAGRGVCLGHRAPGWFPYSALVGGTVPSALKVCFASLTHWEHARFVVEEQIGLGGEVARQCYAAGLRLVHSDDPRVKPAMHAGRNFIRLERRWTTLRGETYTKSVQPILAKLPACQYVAEGRAVPDFERVARFEQPVDLSDMGYPTLTPIWGMRVYSHRLPLRDPNQISIVLNTRDLAADNMASFRPRYIRRSERRLDEAGAWERVRRVLPGVNEAVVKLLIAARGISEAEISMPPMIFISGPTSSSKSMSVVLAATMCGDMSHSVTWTSNVERVRQQILEAKELGSYVVFNEIVKDSRNQGQSIIQTMDVLLNLTPDSMSHKLYVGPMRLGGLPVFVWTDTAVPHELKQDAQLARRLVHAHLPRQVNWATPLKETGVNQVRFLRTADLALAEACNTIVSCVIDEFFDQPRTFEEIANALGFATLADSDEAREGKDTLLLLFRACCAAKPVSGADAKRWKGRGWKVVQRDQDSELGDLWKQVCDEGFVGSRRCTEVDWSKITGCEPEVKFECRSHGSYKVAIRFVRYKTQKTYSVNEELLDGKVELEPERDGAGGPRDPVGGQPAAGWGEGLPKAFID